MTGRCFLQSFGCGSGGCDLPWGVLEASLCSLPTCRFAVCRHTAPSSAPLQVFPTPGWILGNDSLQRRLRAGQAKSQKLQGRPSEGSAHLAPGKWLHLILCAQAAGGQPVCRASVQRAD